MKKRKWTPEQLHGAAKSSRSIRELLQKLDLRPAGGNYSQMRKYIQEANISIDHFVGQGWNVDAQNLIHDKIPLSEILMADSSYQSFKLKKRLFSEKLKEKKCEKCSWSEMALDGRIPLELHHINGDRRDNRLENLQILCPNCHSLEDSHRGRNIRRKA